MSKYTVMDDTAQLQTPESAAAPTYLEAPYQQETYLQKHVPTLQGTIQEMFMDLPQPVKTGLGGIANYLETMVGLPGAAANFGMNLARKGISYGPESMQGLLGQGEVPFLSTPQSLHERTKAVTGEALQPKTKSEELAQEFISDTLSLMTPIPGLAAGMKAGRALATSGAANVLSGVAKAAGFGKGTQGLAKAAVFLAEPLAGTTDYLGKHKDELYDIASKAMGEDTVAGAKLSQWAESTAKQIKDKRGFPNKDIVEDMLERVGNIVENKKPITAMREKGSIDPLTKIFSMKPVETVIKRANPKAKLQDIWDLKKDINNHIAKLSSDPKGNSIALHELKTVNRELNSILREYGSRNKQFGAAFETAEELHQALFDKSKFTKTLDKVLSDEKLQINPWVHLILHAYPQGVAPAIGAAALGYGAKNMYKAFEVLKKSPQARSLVGKIFATGTAKNSKALAGYLKDLSNEFDKYTGETHSPKGKYTIKEEE